MQLQPWEEQSLGRRSAFDRKNHSEVPQAGTMVSFTTLGLLLRGQQGPFHAARRPRQVGLRRSVTMIEIVVTETVTETVTEITTVTVVVTETVTEITTETVVVTATETATETATVTEIGTGTANDET